jgi:putative FmdB family regulatory protein
VPLYEYECAKHGTFEQVQKFSDPPLTKCPTCGGPIEKLLSAPAIQFKGTGWYITDYARKGDSGGKKDEGKKDTASSSKSTSESSSSGSSSSDAKTSSSSGSDKKK